MGGNTRLPDGRFFLKGQSYELTQAEVQALQPAPSQGAEKPKSPPPGFVPSGRLQNNNQWKWYDADLFRKGKRVEVPVQPLMTTRVISPEEAERLNPTPEYIKRGIHRQQIKLMQQEAGDEVAIRHLQSLPKAERVALLRFLPELKHHFLEDFPNG